VPVHTIRLRGAWKIERRADGSAVFERAFGSPRTLDAGESIWLVCNTVPGNGTVLVNGIAIGDAVAGSAFQGDATGAMQPRNSVRLELRAVGHANLGEVSLEFRSADREKLPIPI